MELKAYFQSYENYFWEWKTDEDVPGDAGYHDNNLLSVPGVGAIAYRPYVMEILKELQPQGWPPFGALLMVLYALQEGYTDFAGPLRRTADSYSIDKFKFSAEKGIEFLEKIRTLPTVYKQKQNRMVLLQTIFHKGHNRMSSLLSDVNLKIYYKRPHELAGCAEKQHASPVVLNRDLGALDLNEKFPTTQSIIDAMKGLVEEPELDDEVVLEETTADTTNDFIKELVEEPKTFQVGSLIKRIWSGLKIPMRHLSPGEQPIGGISDMTNKGDFNRMLLSEFANEDEVFMNRVANNEALYIQREIPPEENIFERIILIDTSLRNWGTPKVLAFASAIAVIKHPKGHSECKVFALGQAGIPISLDKVEEVVENLNQVSPILEASEALERFFNEEHTAKDIEVFFITHQDNMADEKIQKVVHQNRDRLKFLVTTTSDGEINFYKHHKGARKHIQKIRLPLQELWANPPQQKAVVVNNGKKTNLPLNYPILFPTPVNKIAQFLYEGEFFILSSKKQLLKTYLSDNYYDRHSYDYYKTFHGCEVLFENISVKPTGKFALAKNRQQHFILCQYQPEKKLVSKLNLNTKEYSEQNVMGLNIPNSYNLIYFGKNFFLHEPSNPSLYKINIEGNVSVEFLFNKYDEIDRNSAKAAVEVAKLNKSGLKIINNFHKIGINSNGNLAFSEYEIERVVYDNTFHLCKNRYKIDFFAEQNKNKHTFPDGSEIITDSRGMLTFRSSNKGIDEFYIPSTIGFLSLATQTEFGGSEYYLPERNLLKVRTFDEMHDEYLRPFLKQILDYGV